jgi:hypothetical protein
MSKKKDLQHRHRLVTFLNKEDYQLFREACFRRDILTAQLMREIVSTYLHKHEKP